MSIWPCKRINASESRSWPLSKIVDLQNMRKTDSRADLVEKKKLHVQDSCTQAVCWCTALCFVLCQNTAALLAAGKVLTCATQNNCFHLCAMCNKIAGLPQSSLRAYLSRGTPHCPRSLSHRRSSSCWGWNFASQRPSQIRKVFERPQTKKNTSTETAAVPMQRSNLISICVHSGKVWFTRATTSSMNTLSSLIYHMWHHVPRRRAQTQSNRAVAKVPPGTWIQKPTLADHTVVRWAKIGCGAQPSTAQSKSALRCSLFLPSFCSRCCSPINT